MITEHTKYEVVVIDGKTPAPGSQVTFTMDNRAYGTIVYWDPEPNGKVSVLWSRDPESDIKITPIKPVSRSLKANWSVSNQTTYAGPPLDNEEVYEEEEYRKLAEEVVNYHIDMTKAMMTSIGKSYIRDTLIELGDRGPTITFKTSRQFGHNSVANIDYVFAQDKQHNMVRRSKSVSLENNGPSW